MFRNLGTTSPIADLLQPLLQPLADMLQKEGDKLRSGGDSPPPEAIALYTQARQVKKVGEYLEKHAFAYESALPLELGKASWQLIDSIKALVTPGFDGLPPLAKELTSDIAGVAKETAFASAPARKGPWKTAILLDNNELARQARMIDLYLERGQIPLAVGLMREWVISWAMLTKNQTKGWLILANREPSEQHLGALGALAKDPASTPAQRKFGTFWNQLANALRNALHHHAMREEAIEKRPTELKSVQEFWNQLKEDKVTLPPC